MNLGPLKPKSVALCMIQVYFEKRRVRNGVSDPTVPRRHLNMLNTIVPSTDGTNKYVQVNKYKGRKGREGRMCVNFTNIL